MEPTSIDAQPQTIRQGLLSGQLRLLQDREHTHLAAVGGVGSGKTTLGFAWHHDRCLINAKSPYSLYVSETGKYSKIQFRGYIDFIESLGWREKVHFRANRSAPYSIRYYFGHEVLFWSAETKIVSLNTSHDSRDEEALFPPDRVRELDQRRRHPDAKLLQSLSMSSPEGLNHFFEFFGGADMQREGRYSFNDTKLVLHSSSYDNPFLPESYFRTLEENFGWDDAYFKNYVLGEWTNLSRNAFYFAFSDDNIRAVPLDKNIRRLNWTLDNNVGQMHWATMQEVGNEYRIVGANRGMAQNIQVACDEFMRAYPPQEFGNWTIPVYGDFKLHDRSNQSFTTGFQLLEQIMRPKYPGLFIAQPQTGNPLVVERSMTSNKLFKEQRLVIDPACKRVIHSARATQSDGRGGVLKPAKDDVTHGMECVDHMLCVIAPVKGRREFRGAVW